MLVTKGKVSKGDVVTFKLISGEEIAGKVGTVGNDDIEVEKPVSVQLTPRGVVPIPALMSAGEFAHITLRKKDIMYSSPASKEFVAVYNQATSPIVQAPAGSILR